MNKNIIIGILVVAALVLSWCLFTKNNSAIVQPLTSEKFEESKNQLPPELITALTAELQKPANYQERFRVFSITSEGGGMTFNDIFAVDKNTHKVYMLGMGSDGYTVKDGKINVGYGSGSYNSYIYNNSTDKFEDTLPPNNEGI